eukprot:6428835-Amphidinium_carterae.2
MKPRVLKRSCIGKETGLWAGVFKEPPCVKLSECTLFSMKDAPSVVVEMRPSFSKAKHQLESLLLLRLRCKYSDGCQSMVMPSNFTSGSRL